MPSTAAHSVVHLELQTGNLPRACDFFTRLFHWRAEMVCVGSASYLTLELGDRIGGGVVEKETDHSFWLPYVEVADVAEATERARMFGAWVTLEPREGPTGWRSVLFTPACGGIGLWQPKT